MRLECLPRYMRSWCARRQRFFPPLFFPLTRGERTNGVLMTARHDANSGATCGLTYRPEKAAQYRVGIMMMDVERRNSQRFRAHAIEATRQFEDMLSDTLGLKIELLTFVGPHLTPAGGGYRPLDFLHIGIAEKLEREVHFLLIITEVDLTATTFAYTLALPSQLTNVGIVSTKRLDPAFWGKDPP